MQQNARIDLRQAVLGRNDIYDASLRSTHTCLQVLASILLLGTLKQELQSTPHTITLSSHSTSVSTPHVARVTPHSNGEG